MSYPLDTRSDSVSESLLNGHQHHSHDHEDVHSSTPSSVHASERFNHGKHTKWIKFPFRRILQIIIGMIILAIVISSVVGSVLGIKKIHRLKFPHKAVHATTSTLTAPSKIVTPYFVKSKTGAPSNADAKTKMVVTIWHRKGTHPPPRTSTTHDMGDSYWMIENEWYEEQRRIRFGGEQGFIRPELTPQHDWTEVWSVDIDDLDIEETRNVKTPVTLPGEIIHSLITNNRSSLVATFQLVPSFPPNVAGKTYEHASSRPIELYGPSQPWPISYASGQIEIDNPPTPLDSFFAHSGVGQSIHVRMMDWRKAGRERSIDSNEDQRHAAFANFIWTRTFVTLSKDYSVYDVESFKDAQDSLREFKNSCAQQEYFWDDCYRTFAKDGHFENLLSIENENGEKEWKYGPFLTTRLSPSAPKDYLELPQVDMNDAQQKTPEKVGDFTFVWHLTFSALSPAKLAMASVSHGVDEWAILNRDDSRSAKDYDDHEFNSALLGLSFDPESRPISRGIIHGLSVILRAIASPLILHYWLTRRTSTGIALLTLTAQSIVDLTSYIVLSALMIDDISVFFFVVIIILSVLIILKQIHLFAKPEFMLSPTFIPFAQITLPLPTAVRFKMATVAEKQSYKLDLELDWKYRVLLGISTFCILRFAPAPPAIVGATRYADVMHGFGGAQHWDPTALSVIHLFRTIQSAFWLVSQLSQIHLNYRHKTFGGSHKITTYLLFGSLFLSHLTKIFVRYFGRPQLMQPLTTWDLVTLVASATMVFQAVRLPVVGQAENENVD
ncbi:uncharacterized protein I303_104600 [Kwoniella dejecticola CBS 10117]|uniref:Uncharacterized protein n=1 Tax=Kwoniella dejecticola CBS 10117 TaxID=1296121 RepID=A0A1A6A4V5_9TREE|nr:uncharacterized protein I303_04422 [Kwoniella dejecticola CBS 10117]OBR85091.1 hypothetical protein I303_04422 [Kwoniella dejecticola CBS 10117]